jgi:hypothetical protein
VLARRSTNHDLRRLKSLVLRSALLAAPIAVALMFPAPKADATRYFARQTGRGCSFCHSGVPRLNDTGLAFKNNGFRFLESYKRLGNRHKDMPPH